MMTEVQDEAEVQEIAALEVPAVPAFHPVKREISVSQHGAISARRLLGMAFTTPCRSSAGTAWSLAFPWDSRALILPEHVGQDILKVLLERFDSR